MSLVAWYIPYLLAALSFSSEGSFLREQKRLKIIVKNRGLEHVAFAIPCENNLGDLVLRHLNAFFYRQIAKGVVRLLT